MESLSELCFLWTKLFCAEYFHTVDIQKKSSNENQSEQFENQEAVCFHRVNIYNLHRATNRTTKTGLQPQYQGGSARWIA